MDWRHRAACLDEDPELFFPIGNTGPALLQIEEAKAVCRRCEVVDTCLQVGPRVRPGRRRLGRHVRGRAPRAQAPQRPRPPRRLTPPPHYPDCPTRPAARRRSSATGRSRATNRTSVPRGSAAFPGDPPTQVLHQRAARSGCPGRRPAAGRRSPSRQPCPSSATRHLAAAPRRPRRSARPRSAPCPPPGRRGRARRRSAPAR